jgi:hypothetical protein
MDETSVMDLIEYWNYRSLGLRIIPLPVSLAPQMTQFCEKIIKANHRPYSLIHGRLSQYRLPQ